MRVNTGVYLDKVLLDQFDFLAKAHHQSRNARIQLLMRRDLQENGYLQPTAQPNNHRQGQSVISVEPEAQLDGHHQKDEDQPHIPPRTLTRRQHRQNNRQTTPHQ